MTAIASLVAPTQEQLRRLRGSTESRAVQLFIADLLSGVQGLSGAGGTQADLIFEAATELTIASGAVTVTQAVHTLDTESDAASDDLDTLAGGSAEEVIFVRPANAARTVVLKHAIGANCIACPGARDISLAEATDWAMLCYNGTQWICLAYSTLALGGGGIGSALASVANGLGASLVGIEDAAASLKGTTVEAALAELATPIGLSAAAEAGDNIVVTVAGVAHVAQYVARVYDAAMLLCESAAFTIAESGAGAEVSTTAKASLLFTTDANGAASLTIHDVAGASGASLFLEVSPMSVQAGAKASPTGVLAITFDGS